LQPLEACFGCYVKQADVIIRKRCNRPQCTPCHCRRPLWCISCLAQVVMAAKENRNERIENRAACPTCRAIFC
ncbi:hypothetical protein PFISCL1PPCAC_1153, partial [Pristionchus fissidentatus]